MTRTSRGVAASFAAVAMLVTAACTGDDHKGSSSGSPTLLPTGTASTSDAGKPPAKNPFTGIGPVPKNPTISVKIDDTAPGRPQVGVDKADIVYIEAVEGGLTRLAAIFATHMVRVGYVRSTRPSDPELLLQFGKITAAYSGGAHDSLPRMRRSGIKRWSNDAGAPYYTRSNRAASSYINLVLDLRQVARKVKTTRPRNIGWTFSPSMAGYAVRPGSRVETAVTGSYRSGTHVDFRYSAKLRKYVRYIDGVAQHTADGHLITATNVIVQSCRVVSHPRDRDVLGNPSQFTYTVGSGPVSVFRQGKRINGTWSRPRVNSGTTLRTPAGRPISLAPGNSWVVLIRKGIPVTG